jgi:hypothetical protein
MQLKECEVCHRVGYKAFVPYGDAGWRCGRDDLCRARVHRVLSRWLRGQTLTERLYVIERYQDDGRVHPLTCGVDSQHLLVPRVVDDAVILRCSECSYDQHWIPWHVLRPYAIRHGLTKEED